MVSSSVSESRYSAFDNFGRLLASQQVTDGRTYDFTYKYSLSGALIEQTYPSGRVVRNHVGNDGGLVSVSSKGSNSPFRNYASNFDYSAAGIVRSMMFGNGLWESAEFNSRFQITGIGLGSSPTDTGLWKMNYEYGELNPDGVTVDASKNIGQIAKQTVTLPTTGFVQTFRYDAVNRLTEAKETTSGNQNWIQTFGYDRFGNRTEFSQNIGGTQLPINNQTRPTVDPATNRFEAGQGYLYDFNGNIVQDAWNLGFAYNGDDKQSVVRDLTIPTNSGNPDANVIGRYFYDGEGARVKKVTNTETTVFVYDGFGALAAEYSTVAPPVNPTTSYLTTDLLGSPRVITDRQGNVISRRDFMPFGEEIGAGIGGRTEARKYSLTGSDNVRQRFTGYEKDIETELDFAEARMYRNKHGRFTAPDPLLSSASLGNPQTFNRYVYVGNDPVNVTDPSGLDWCRRSSDGATKWTGPNVACEGEYGENLTTEVRTVSSGSFTTDSGYIATKGDEIRFNSDGTTTLVQIDPKKIALRDAVNVEVTSNPASTVTVDAPAAEVGSTISPRQTDRGPDLGCPEWADSACGSGNSPVSPSLDTSNNEPLKTVEAIDKVATVLQLIPLTSAPASIIKIAIAAGRGEPMSAGENLAMSVPFVAPFKRLGTLVRTGEEIVEGVQFTKSSLQLGQEIHKLYKLAEVVEGVAIKEFRGIPGIRPDFVNFATKTIYELKPFNPRGLRSGAKQLEKYRKAFEKRFPGTQWKTVLDTY